MTTLAELQTKVRNFVKDVNDTPKVSDEELAEYIGYALADYSYHFPRMLVAEYEAAALLDVPTDMVPDENSVEGVEVSSELWTKAEIGQGEKFPTTGKFWYWRGSQVALASLPSVSIYLHYRGLHAFVAPEEGDAVLSVPKANEELLVIYAAAKFHQKIGTVAAKLDRFKERGERDDNPLVFMHDVLMRQYYAKIADRMPRGTVKIWGRP
jgi:hypothetical protein